MQINNKNNEKNKNNTCEMPSNNIDNDIYNDNNIYNNDDIFDSIIFYHEPIKKTNIDKITNKIHNYNNNHDDCWCNKFKNINSNNNEKLNKKKKKKKKKKKNLPTLNNKNDDKNNYLDDNYSCYYKYLDIEDKYL